LAQRESSLNKRKLAAERLIQQREELLKKERELDQKEASVNKLVDQAMEMLQQTPLQHPRPVLLGPTLLEHSMVSLSEPSSARSGSYIAEELQTTESIAEQLSPVVTDGTTTGIPTEYADATFESTPSKSQFVHAVPVTSSTPDHTHLPPDDSLRDLNSVTGKMSVVHKTVYNSYISLI